MHIGKQIRLARLTAGLTQDQLGELVNKSRPLISHIENTGTINHDTWLRIKKVLKIPDVVEKQGNYQNVNYTESSDHDKKELISSLKREIETLQELVAAQKETIELLRERK